jgi:methyltransferase (TIGR00027 family)
MDENQTTLHLSNLGETAFLTLYARAIESQSANPILKDEKAEAIIQQLDPILKTRELKMARQLTERKLDPMLVIHLTLRAEKYDRTAKQFLARHPGATIVNLGCGLDTRFFRIDDGRLQCVDIDLPEMITLKRQLIQETPRYRMLAVSILDHAWMEEIEKTLGPYCFLMEGLLMYLPEDEVKRLILAMRDRFSGSEMVCEVTHRQWVTGLWGKLVALKMQKRTKIGRDARFQFGLRRPDEMETWGEGIAFLEDWFYMDEDHPKIGWMRAFKNWRIFRTAQYTTHYQFKESK